MSCRTRRSIFVVLAGLLAVLTACGDGDDSTDPAAGGPADSVLSLPWVAIAAMEPPVGNELTFQTVPTLADGEGECRAPLVSEVSEGAEEIYVYLSLDTAARPPFDGCELTSRTVTVTLPAMPAEVRVFDSLGGTFTYIDGEIDNCPGGPMICNNDPAACDNATLHDAIANADVPAHFDMPFERCEPPFAVVDVDYGAGSCPPDDGAPNPCAGRRIHRMYWRIVDERWVQIGLDDTAGCGTILTSAPDFPPHLCEDLEAIS
jgi:hypothetical protein